MMPQKNNLSDLQLLTQARQRMQALLDDLLQQQAELDASPPAALDRAQIETGQQTLQTAVDSARQMLHSIDRALAAIQGS